MRKLLPLCFVVVGIIFVSGCTDISNNFSADDKNIKIQKELKTPDGITVKIELVEDSEGRKSVEGLVENPTNDKLSYVGAGILIEYVDEYDLDKNTEWMYLSTYWSCIGTIEPRHSLPISISINNERFKSTTEIKPFIRYVKSDNPVVFYPPCFAGDPRQECYTSKYVPGKGYIKVPTYQ